MQQRVFTIGHSSQEFSSFLKLLQQHGVTAVGDVRSAPYSRRYPQFSREPLEKALRDAGITYVYLGKELGARSDDPGCYENGSVRYQRLAKTELFQAGLDRVERGLQSFTLALMCAEKEPLHCHRSIRVSREVEKRGIRVEHILADGSLERHSDTESRLLKMLRLGETDLFRSREEVVADAYSQWGDRIAYTRAEEQGQE
jgi:uncharacterized protein (DUF488 family)